MTRGNDPSSKPDLHDDARERRLSGFQRKPEGAPAPGARPTPHDATPGWRVIEQFEQDGFRYRVVRRPVEPNDAVRRLTKREMQVLDYASDGHSNKSIAYALGLSPSTVGVLLFRAAAKLEAKSRIQLLLVYSQRKKNGELP